MLDKLIAEKWLVARGVAGLWRCRREEDDVLVTARNEETKLAFLRQQIKNREGRANMCLAAFIAPEGEDWIGGFAVAIHRIDPHPARFKPFMEDYSDILLKPLADRLAEAFDERLHHLVRINL